MPKHRPDSMLWWKPWEVSNGTTIKVVQNVSSSNFGLVLNSSIANEVFVIKTNYLK